MTKFGLMHSGKGEIIVAEDSKEWNNGAIKRTRAAASISVPSLFWRVNELQRIIENILCLLQVFSLHDLKFDLYLLKQSISELEKETLNEHIWWLWEKVGILLLVIGIIIYAQPSFTTALVKH